MHKEEPVEPKWIQNLDNKIKQLRRDISYTQLILSCSVNTNYTEHQHRICERLQNVKCDTLVYRVKLLTQELKATSSKVSYHRKKIQQDRINRLFVKKPTLVYRSFWGGTVEINKAPSMDEVEKFWKDIWGKKVNFNEKPIWLRTLESEYCKNIKPKSYQITTSVLDAMISKIQNNKAPGIEQITGFWYKSLHSYCHGLVLFNKAFSGLIDIPGWLTRVLTRFLPKNDETDNPKTYQPIACQNIMLKLYTSCINLFLKDHCEINSFFFFLRK